MNEFSNFLSKSKVDSSEWCRQWTLLGAQRVAEGDAEGEKMAAGFVVQDHGTASAVDGGQLVVVTRP